MDHYHMLMHERFFSDPATFRPECWLYDPRGPDVISPPTHYLTVCGRGIRMCLGLPSCTSASPRWSGAIIANLVGTTVRDVTFYADKIILSPWAGTNGVRVLLESSSD